MITDKQIKTFFEAWKQKVSITDFDAETVIQGTFFKITLNPVGILFDGLREIGNISHSVCVKKPYNDSNLFEALMYGMQLDMTNNPSVYDV